MSTAAASPSLWEGVLVAGGEAEQRVGVLEASLEIIPAALVTAEAGVTAWP